MEPLIISAILKGFIIYGVLRSISALLKYSQYKNQTFKFIGLWIEYGSGWVLLLACNYMSPLWIPILLGFGLSIISLKWIPEKIHLYLGGIPIVVIGIYSIPFTSYEYILLNIFIVLISGFIIDKTVGTWFVKKKKIMSLCVIVLLTIIGFRLRTEIKDVIQYESGYFFRNISLMSRGRKIELPEGVMAWGDFPHRDSKKVAIQFHGAHPDGSYQPVPVLLRRVLISAGYNVLSVDHPGFGKSTMGESWNPAYAALSAYEYVRENWPQAEIMLVGHSKGMEQVLRLQDQVRNGIVASVLIGSGLKDVNIREDYWFKRFHRDREIEPILSKDKWREIYDQYYHRPQLLSDMNEGHAPITFVQLENDFEDVINTRDQVFNLIKGTKSKVMIKGSSHYFNATATSGLLFADGKIIRQLRKVFNDL